MSGNDRITDYINQIKEAHFNDLEKEKTLCGELLEYSDKNGNVYGKGFAYTYLFDYYVCAHDSDGCVSVMKNALEYNMEEGLDDLLMQVYNFCGIYYSYIHDDMTSFEYFLKSLDLAEKFDDKLMRYRLYNNIAASFHNHNAYDTAFPYYRQAYELMKCSELDQTYIHYQLYLLQNLINCCIAMDDRDGVRFYCEELRRFYETYPSIHHDPSIPYQHAVILAYYGKTEEAVAILREYLSWEKEDPLDISDIIELYPLIFDFLLEKGEKDLAWKVLVSLHHYIDRESPQAKQVACVRYIRFYQAFGMGEELNQAYQSYYQASREALGSLAKNRIDAMKEKIYTFEVRQKIARLQRLSYLDGLCEIYNRRFYMEHLEQAMTDDKVKQLGIVVIDIDCFKEYNDFYGHDMGDKVLQKVARCLKEGGNPHIVSCRYGGDEFSCICINLTEEEISSFLAAFRSRLAQLHIPHIESEVSSCVTASCGFSSHEKAELTGTAELFHEADRALYQAKSRGRNCFVSYRNPA